MLKWGAEFLRRNGSPEDNLDAEELELVERRRIQRGAREIPLPNSQLTENRVPLDRAIKDIKREPYNPEVVTQFQQSLLASSIENSRTHVSIPVVAPCTYSPQELKENTKRGLVAIYRPGISYPSWGLIFPEMRSWIASEGGTISNERQFVGWTDMEGAKNAPYTNTTEEALLRKTAGQGRLSGSLEGYIVLGQTSKLLMGYYPDQGSTYSRLLGSRCESRVVSACFYSDGRLNVNSSLGPENRYPNLGGRSEGVR